jgi:hypothetical protein
MSSPAQILAEQRKKYPGMLPREILIWETWLKTNAGRFDTYDYNVRVGDGRDPGAGFPQWARDMAISSSQLRLDVLAWNGTQATIIEVEENPGMRAIGQIIGYETFWVRDNRTLPRPRLLLIVAVLNSDPALVATRAGIAVEVVKTDFSVLYPKRQ